MPPFSQALTILCFLPVGWCSLSFAVSHTDKFRRICQPCPHPHQEAQQEKNKIHRNSTPPTAPQESRRYSGPARDPGEVSEAEAKEEEEAENVASNIRFGVQLNCFPGFAAVIIYFFFVTLLLPIHHHHPR